MEFYTFDWILGFHCTGHPVHGTLDSSTFDCVHVTAYWNSMVPSMIHWHRIKKTHDADIVY